MEEKKHHGGILGDRYERRARLQPALIALFPLALAATALFPDERLAIGALASTSVYFGLTALLAQFVRKLGKSAQPALYLSWGGPPTTRLLRHREPALGATTRVRVHSNLKKLIPTLTIPSPKEEVRDPDAADEIYDSAVKYLLSKTRDRTRFALVFQENINYGFARNLFGLRKRVGIPAAAVGSLLCAVATGVAWRRGGFPPVAFLSMVVDLGLLGLWVFGINPGWVKVAADAYARELLGTTEVLVDSTPTATKVG
jgi:hypothetical protein